MYVTNKKSLLFALYAFIINFVKMAISWIGNIAWILGQIAKEIWIFSSMQDRERDHHSLMNARALFWTYNPKKGKCWLKSSDSGRREDPKVVSGNRECGLGEFVKTFASWDVILASLPFAWNSISKNE